MKKLLFILAIGFSASLTAQVLTPKASLTQRNPSKWQATHKGFCLFWGPKTLA
jgi:hypothetical protein